METVKRRRSRMQKRATDECITRRDQPARNQTYTSFENENEDKSEAMKKTV
jgi:hypothetical protein